MTYVTSTDTLLRFSSNNIHTLIAWIDGKVVAVIKNRENFEFFSTFCARYHCKETSIKQPNI